MNEKRDKIYAEPLAEVASFTFDERVADVFPDMIRRSVPGYGTIISMIATLAERFAQTDSHCYDLGCSLGAATLSLAAGIKVDNCDIIAIDNSEAMVARCQNNIARANLPVPVTVSCADIIDTPIEDASVVVMNFTLQFIDPDKRLAILRRIYQGLKPGGILILSEKVGFDDPRVANLQVELHHAFKRAQGYSDLEISQKRSALENVLIPETLPAHKARLEQAGFSSCEVWFQCFNFASLVAHK